ncbi:SDR family NAD(P)-dependent oxidoreductase [Streptomyces griseoruber]
MAGRLTGRTAVVTGGSTGIGQEIARRLAAEGADIAVADIDPADETRDLVAETGRRFFSDRVDVSDEDAIHGFAARVRRELGAADILVNNAAVVVLADIDHVTLDEWRRTFAVNVDGPFLASRAFLPDLKESGSGRIINITSASYRTPPPPFVSYVSAKGALNGFTSALAANLAAHHITVNGVAASLVRTAGRGEDERVLLRADRADAEHQACADAGRRLGRRGVSRLRRRRVHHGADRRRGRRKHAPLRGLFGVGALSQRPPVQIPRRDGLISILT